MFHQSDPYVQTNPNTHSHIELIINTISYTHMDADIHSRFRKRIESMKISKRRRRKWQNINVFRSRLEVLCLIVVNASKETHNGPRHKCTYTFCVCPHVAVHRACLFGLCHPGKCENDAKCQIHAGTLMHRFIGLYHRSHWFYFRFSSVYTHISFV